MTLFEQTVDRIEIHFDIIATYKYLFSKKHVIQFYIHKIPFLRFLLQSFREGSGRIDPLVSHPQNASRKPEMTSQVYDY